jgi:hypothetical protein
MNLSTRLGGARGYVRVYYAWACFVVVLSEPQADTRAIVQPSDNPYP